MTVIDVHVLDHLPATGVHRRLPVDHTCAVLAAVGGWAVSGCALGRDDSAALGNV